MASHELKPFILGLPNEVLTEILERFARSGEPTKPILFVCHRFYQLGIPVHYKRLTLSSSEHVSRSKPRMVELQRTLQKEPGLGEYCRDLCICSNDANDSDSNDRNSGKIITVGTTAIGVTAIRMATIRTTAMQMTAIPITTPTTS
uniref:F-box domain-containing protein n=1 Tax=Bionectria ochroleuca TaxID=29856 RepID=A0A8H7NQP0_BIOOC